MQPPVSVVRGEISTDNSTWLEDSDKTCDHTRRATKIGFTRSCDKRLSEIWNSQLIRSIRINHANLSSIAEYEENESLSKDLVET
jgi:hypothetical protein